jgi:hypothetical protein
VSVRAADSSMVVQRETFVTGTVPIQPQAVSVESPENLTENVPTRLLPALLTQETVADIVDAASDGEGDDAIIGLTGAIPSAKQKKSRFK